MGYPMTYTRVVGRNQLHGDYQTPRDVLHRDPMIAGDLRRLETDQRDERHLRLYADLAGVTMEQVKVILDAFFEGRL